MTYTTTSTETYSVLDIETVFRSFKTELRMIADSSRALTRAQADEYGHDAEYLAKNGYLKSVDATLFDEDGEEVQAAVYSVNTAAGDLTPSRPGGVLWPKTPDGFLRILLFYTPEWYRLTDDARARVSRPLKLAWGPTDADYSHATLRSGSSRAFVSGAYGVQRQDYSK